MEGVTDEGLVKLSKTEQRKLKLAEYLAAKGRLKASNPKPYLKDKPVAKKNTETHPKAKLAGDEKENCNINITDVKEVKRVQSLSAVSKKPANSSSNTKPGTNSVFRGIKESSTISCKSSLRTTVSQSDLKVLRGQSKRPASLQNSREPHKTEKTASSQPQRILQNVQTKVQQSQPPSNAGNKTQKSTKLSHGLSQPGRAFSTHRKADTKTEVQTKKPLTLVKTASAVKDQPKSQRPANNTETKVQTSRQVPKAQTRLANPTQPPRAPSVVPKFGINSRPHNSNAQTVSRTSQSVTNRSNKNQRKDLLCVAAEVNNTKRKSQNAVINNATKTRVSSTVPKPTNNDSTAIIKNKQHTAVKAADVTAAKQTFNRRARSSVLPQTTTSSQKPQLPSKRSSQAKPTVQFQTPKTSFCPSAQGVRTAPVDARKNLTAAQEERLRKLQEWRESRGIQYKRPPMPVRLMRRKTVSALPQPYWTAMEQEDEVHNIVFVVDRSLDDCIKLVQQGFPAEQVKEVLSRVPMAQKFAKYWICQARLMEREGNMEVLSMFKEAVRVVREPVDELRSVVFDILKKNQAQGVSPIQKESEVEADDEKEIPGDITCTPKPVGALICGMRGDSSVVKYKITATPGGKRSQQMAEPGQVDGHEIRFFTPVRRSVRIEKTARRYPTVLQEHDPCVTSLSDLAGDGKAEVKGDSQPQNSPVYVYRENEALRNHVQVQLLYPEEEETS